jgi:hypothetical protein
MLAGSAFSFAAISDDERVLRLRMNTLDTCGEQHPGRKELNDSFPLHDLSSRTKVIGDSRTDGPIDRAARPKRQILVLELHSADSPSRRELVIGANACVERQAPFRGRIEIHQIVGAGPGHAAENAGIGSPVLETSAVSRASAHRDGASVPEVDRWSIGQIRRSPRDRNRRDAIFDCCHRPGEFSQDSSETLARE